MTGTPRFPAFDPEAAYEEAAKRESLRQDLERIRDPNLELHRAQAALKAEFLAVIERRCVWILRKLVRIIERIKR